MTNMGMFIIIMRIPTGNDVRLFIIIDMPVKPPTAIFPGVMKNPMPAEKIITPTKKLAISNRVLSFL